MEFCVKCDGLLVPKKDKKTKKTVLVCQVCGETYEISEQKKSSYMLVKEIKHSEKEKIEVITEDFEDAKITEEKRQELLEAYKETIELFEY